MNFQSSERNESGRDKEKRKETQRKRDVGVLVCGGGGGGWNCNEVKMLGSVYKEINYCRAERRYTYSGLSLVKLRIWHGKVRNYEFSVSWR